MKNNFKELVVVGENKLGIFNTRTCEFVVKPEYDCVLLSNCGSHIVKKYKYIDEIDEFGEKYSRREVVFNAIVDNDGNVVEYKNLFFYDEFVDGVVVAYSVDTAKRHLVSSEGELLSSGYDRIDYIAGGLYYAYNLKDNPDYDPNVFEKSTSWFLDDIKLMSNNGKILPFTLVLDDIENPQYAKIKEIDSYEKFVSAILDYGFGIAQISFAYIRPTSVSELLDAIEASINYAKQNKKVIADVISLVNIFAKDLNFVKLNLDVELGSIDFNFESLCLGIERNYFKKYIMDTLIEPIYKFNNLLLNK